MTIKHHPCSASLMSCSAGSMPEAFAAVMASHMAMCPDCNRDLALMQQIGEVLFDKLQPVAVNRPAPSGAFHALEADRGAPIEISTPKGDVPGPLVSVVGAHLDSVPWKRVAPGVWQHQIALSDDSRGDLRLIKVAPGQQLPEHGHRGNELTLVLRGSYSDASGTYRAGDVADLDQTVEHQPVADAVDGCICLIAVEGKLRFKSRIARLVQPFVGM